MKNVVFKSLMTWILCSSQAIAAPVRLTQKDVAEMVLKQGPDARVVSLQYAQQNLPLAAARSVLGWTLSLDAGKEIDRSVAANSVEYYKLENLTSSFALSKTLITGTVLKTTFSRKSQLNDLSTTTDPQLTTDVLGLEIQQPIWGNIFGVGTRAALSKAELDYKASTGLRKDALEDLVLTSLRGFWNVYVTQENFRESVASRERTEKLVAAVKRKTAVGYSNPGDLSTVQAELESRIQAVKTASQSFLEASENFALLLGLPSNTEFQLEAPQALPPVPKLSEKKVQDLRRIESSRLQMLAAEKDLDLAESQDKPSINLVGRMSSTGIDPTADGSFAELSGGRYPKAYVGVSLTHSFGSGLLQETVAAKRAAKELAEVKYMQAQDQGKISLIDMERKVGTAFAIAESTQKQKGFREKTVQELTKTYNQGRTDIAALVKAMNDLFSTETEAVKALGNYQIALNEWAAARDELVTDIQPEEKE